jgi:hypothetical protein
VVGVLVVAVAVSTAAEAAASTVVAVVAMAADTGNTGDISLARPEKARLLCRRAFFVGLKIKATGLAGAHLSKQELDASLPPVSA